MMHGTAAKKTRQVTELDNSYIVTIDNAYDPITGNSKKEAGAFNLRSPELFPAARGIEPIERRRLWQQGDNVKINWPRRKGEINIVETEVYGLYGTRKRAEEAREALRVQFEQESREASARARQESYENVHSPFYEDLENGLIIGRTSSPDHSQSILCTGTSAVSPISPELTRKKQKLAHYTPPTGAPNSVQLISMLQKMENSFNSKFDIIFSRLDELKVDNGNLKNSVKELKDTAKTSLRKSREACTLLEGKNSAALKDAVGATDVSTLFDPDLEKIEYMGIDVTEEFNNLFIETGSNQKKFVKGLGQLMYGDDLWFWMITANEGSKPGKRRSLAKRDPNGVTIIENMWRRYFDTVLWPRHPKYLEKMSQPSEKTSTEIAKELKVHKVNAFASFRIQALEWFNGWGNDCRNRLSQHNWTESLFGRLVRREDAVKPPSYNADEEKEWRLKCFQEKSCPKKRDYQVPGVSAAPTTGCTDS